MDGKKIKPVAQFLESFEFSLQCSKIIERIGCASSSRNHTALIYGGFKHMACISKMPLSKNT